MYQLLTWLNHMLVLLCTRKEKDPREQEDNGKEEGQPLLECLIPVGGLGQGILEAVMCNIKS